MTTVEVFADVWCPFAHVGIQRWLARRGEAGREDVRLRIRAWPLELVNGEPLDAGKVQDEIRDLHAQVDVAHLFKGFDPATFPSTTIPALLVTDLAYRRSDEAGEAVALELRDRLFERGEDVSDVAILGAVAVDHALDLSAGWEHSPAAERDRADGTARGVQGSPHFYAPGIDLFCPSLHIERADEHHLEIEDAEARFDDLCTASFAT